MNRWSRQLLTPCIAVILVALPLACSESEEQSTSQQGDGHEGPPAGEMQNLAKGDGHEGPPAGEMQNLAKLELEKGYVQFVNAEADPRTIYSIRGHMTITVFPGYLRVDHEGDEGPYVIPRERVVYAGTEI